MLGQRNEMVVELYDVLWNSKAAVRSTQIRTEMSLDSTKRETKLRDLQKNLIPLCTELYLYCFTVLLLKPPIK